MLTTFFLIIQLCFVIYLTFYIIAFLSGAPFVPSANRTAEAMIELSGIKKGMKIYDLGSGNGKLLFLAAAKGAGATGYEINPVLALYSSMRTLISPYRKQVRTVCKNFWNADISGADVIFVYLLPWRMERLAAKLKKEAHPGTLIVSNSFIFPEWKILRQDFKNHVYVFRI
jgi:SAM-dependent methyltransferase